MTEEDMLMCLIFFIVGYLVARIMRGNGFSVGGSTSTQNCSSLKTAKDCIVNENCFLLGKNVLGCDYNKHQCITSDTDIQQIDYLTCKEKISGNWDKKCNSDNNVATAFKNAAILKGNKKNESYGILTYNRFFTIDNNEIIENKIPDGINNILNTCLK